MAATLVLGPLELSEIERQRPQRVEQGVAHGLGGLARDQDQITSLEQVEESREVAKDQEREVLKDQGPRQENQVVEEVASKVEEAVSKVEAPESKEEVGEKHPPALERNCRLASTSARVSMRGSLARVWPAAQSVAPNDQSKD